jgi:hypothetical protein
MSNLEIGAYVIASKDSVYGYGKIIGMMPSGKYRVLLQQGYMINSDNKMENLNEKLEEKLIAQQEKYMELDLNYYEYDNDAKQECAVRFESEFTPLSNSELDEEDGFVFSFKEEEIVDLEEGDTSPRLVWNSTLTAEQRLDIVGKLLLDPGEYDEAIIGFDENTVYYEIDGVLAITTYLMPSCDPSDYVYNNMLPACSYIREKPFIKFLIDKDEWQEIDDYEDDPPSIVSFKGCEWIVCT